MDNKKSKDCSLSYLVEVCILHGCHMKPRLLTLVLQHVIQQLGGHLDVIAVEAWLLICGAVKQTHNGLGLFTVHP